MKLLIRNEKFIVIMKQKDVKTLLIVGKYLITLLLGLLGGANSEVAQSLLSL